MEIFYLKKDEFLNNIDTKNLENFSDGRKYLSKDKYLEHLCGLFLVKFIAKHVYGVVDTDIIFHGSKPVFKSGRINFSITHSNNLILAAFNNSPIGVDVEFMKNRDFKKLLKRYEKEIKNPKREEFYRFWTLHEAEIKLNDEINSIFSTIYDDNYMLTCVSKSPIITNFRLKQLSVETVANLVDEYDFPKNICIK